MEKIQQLLNEHKDKLRWWLYDIQLSNYNCTDIWLREDVEWDIWNFVKMQSLSDLLFNTPFLSWLEWNWPELWTDWIHFIDWDYSTEPKQSDYHKINLVLLSTDEERIIYLESNLL